MKRVTLTLIVLFVLHFNCIAQKEIIYSFENCVVDSIKQGIKMYGSLCNKPLSSLKLYAVVTENRNEFEIFLQEYSYLPKSGLLDLINSTNRKIKVGKSTIPVIVTTDIMSSLIKKDKITTIPLGGYYIKVVYQDNRQKVAQISFLF